MNLMPDEPRWLLDDGGEHTAHSSTLEACDFLRAKYPERTGWGIKPLADDGTRTIVCEGHLWVVTPA